MMSKRAFTMQDSLRKPLLLLTARETLLFILFVSVLLTVTPLEAQSVATVRPEPAQLELRPGETAALEIRLENARDLYGIDVRLAFDPALLEIIDADPNRDGIQLTPGAFPKPDLVALNAADNAAGTARYVITQLNPTPPATGSGVVFTVMVRALAAGRAELAVPLVEMSDRDGNLLAVNTGSATIEVRGNPAAATGIAIQPPSGESSGEAAATQAPTATAAPESAPTNAAPPENPPPAGATPIAPKGTVGVNDGAEVVSEEAAATMVMEDGAVVAEEVAVVAEEDATETVAIQGETVSLQEEAAIGAAVSSLQAGEAPEQAEQGSPSSAVNAPQVIGGSSNPASVAPAGAAPATESVDGQSPVGVVITAIAVLVLAVLLLTIARRRAAGSADYRSSTRE